MSDHPRSRREFLRLAGGAVLGVVGLPAVLGTAVAQAAASAPPGTATARIVFHGDRSKRVLALTVDDGWSPARVGAIFDILQRSHTSATFLPYTRAMTADRALWRRIAAAGYPIANHTVTHPDLTRLTPQRQRAEIADARATAEDITGHPTLAAFRPPYGAYNQHVVDAALSAGYGTVLLWDTSDRDTSTGGTAAEMLAAAKQGANGSILITHGGPAVTPTILPAIIAYYRSRGFRFVTIGELLGLAGPVPAAARATTPQLSSRPSASPPVTPLGGNPGADPVAAPPIAASPLAAALQPDVRPAPMADPSRSALSDGPGSGAVLTTVVAATALVGAATVAVRQRGRREPR